VHENPHRVGGGLNTHFLASVPAGLRAGLQDRSADHLAASADAVLIEPLSPGLCRHSAEGRKRCRT
jgi:hypothetical protein